MCMCCTYFKQLLRWFPLQMIFTLVPDVHTNHTRLYFRTRLNTRRTVSDRRTRKCMEAQVHANAGRTGICTSLDARGFVPCTQATNAFTQ